MLRRPLSPVCDSQQGVSYGRRSRRPAGPDLAWPGDLGHHQGDQECRQRPGQSVVDSSVAAGAGAGADRLGTVWPERLVAGAYDSRQAKQSWPITILSGLSAQKCRSVLELEKINRSRERTE